MNLAGFVDDAGEFFNDVIFSEVLGFGEVDEGDMGTAEEFFHIVRVTAGVFFVILNTIFELDCADGAERLFIAEDEVDAFAVDEAVGSAAILDADFVTEEGTEADFGDDVEFLAEEVVKNLKTLFRIADHEVFAGAIFETVHSFALAAASSDADENRDQKQ